LLPEKLAPTVTISLFGDVSSEGDARPAPFGADMQQWFLYERTTMAAPLRSGWWTLACGWSSHYPKGHAAGLSSIILTESAKIGKGRTHRIAGCAGARAGPHEGHSVNHARDHCR
jgi:hypothetical protein